MCSRVRCFLAVLSLAVALAVASSPTLGAPGAARAAGEPAVSAASAELIASLDVYLRAVTDRAIGPADEDNDDPATLAAAVEVARSDVLGRLVGGGMAEDRAERLLTAMGDPAIPTGEVEDELSRAFPAEDGVGVWFDRLGVRERGGDGLVHVPSLLAAARAVADPEEVEIAWIAAGHRGANLFELVRGSPRTRTLREILLDATHVAPAVGNRILVDVDELGRRLPVTEQRLERLVGEDVPDTWSRLRPDAQVLAQLVNPRGFVLAQHLVRAESEQRLHAKPDVVVALRAGAAVRKVHRSLDVASRLDVLSRVPGFPARFALADVVASPAGWAVVQGGVGELNMEDPDGLALNALLTAASFAYPDELQEMVLPPELDPGAQTVARLIDLASGRHAGLSLGPVARAARDRMVREALLHAAVAVLKREEASEDALLIHLLEAVVEGNPQDTELIRLALAVATNRRPPVIDIEPWIEKMISGYLARRILYKVSAPGIARTMVWQVRTKLQRNEIHEAAALASTVLMLAPQDFEMLRVVALGAFNAGSREVALYWARQAEAAAVNDAERAAAVQLLEFLNEER